jgi:hypothetical protein
VAAVDAITAARRVSVGRVLAAAWRGFVQASTYETTEGVEIVLCSCSPWLCVPISDGPKQRSARHRPDWGAARETGRTP